MAEIVPVQIWTAAPDGALDFVSSRASRDFGVPTEVLLRDGWKDVVHPDDLAATGARWAHSLATGEPYEVEFRLRMASGSYAWFLARAVAQRDDDGRIVRWFGTNTDIDEQRESQRRTQALLDQVAAQSRETEAAVEAMRRELAEARRRLGEGERP